VGIVKELYISSRTKKFHFYIKKQSRKKSSSTSSSSHRPTSSNFFVDSPSRVDSSDLACSSIVSWLGNETGCKNFSNSSSRHGASLLVFDPESHTTL